MSGLALRSFGNASAAGDVFYNGGVPYDSAGALLVGGVIGPQQPNTYIPFGDSRVANGAADTGTSQILDNCRGWDVTLRVMLNGRLNCIRNAGVSGDTSTDMLARVNADVIAYAPGWCLMMGPVNDIASGVSVATTIANVKEIYARCKRAGIRFATSTISAWTNINTTVEKEAHARYNRWVQAWCYENGIPCADEYRTTGLATTGLPLTNTTFDTNHYSDLGASMAARAWYAVLNPVIPYNNAFSSVPYDYDNLVYDGMGGWTVGASLPSSWATYTANAGTPTDSVVARSDLYQGSLLQTVGTAGAQAAYIGFNQATKDDISTARANSTAYSAGARRTVGGNQYVCTTAGTTAGSAPTFDTTVGATTTDGTAVWTRFENFVPGDVCYGEIEYFVSSISGGNLGFCPHAIFQAQGVSANVTVRGTTDHATRVAPHWDVSGGVLRSRPFVIPAGCTGYITYLRCYMDNGVTGTLQMGRAAIKHVVTP